MSSQATDLVKVLDATSLRMIEQGMVWLAGTCSSSTDKKQQWRGYTHTIIGLQKVLHAYKNSSVIKQIFSQTTNGSMFVMFDQNWIPVDISKLNPSVVVIYGSWINNYTCPISTCHH